MASKDVLIARCVIQKYFNASNLPIYFEHGIARAANTLIGQIMIKSSNKIKQMQRI